MLVNRHALSIELLSKRKKIDLLLATTTMVALTNALQI